MNRQLELLPYDVVEHVAQYLRVSDLLSCCAASIKMRDMFGGDSIWRSKCNSDLVKYLENSKSLVVPSIGWLEVVESRHNTLSQMSKWRKSFMMKIRLFNNWTQNRCDQEDIEFAMSNQFYESTMVTFFKNDYLFFYALKIDESKSRNEIWNITQSDYLHSTFSLDFKRFLKTENISETPIDKYIVFENKLLVTKGNLVLVYEIDLQNSNPLLLTSAFLFNLPEKLSRITINRAMTDPGYYNIMPVHEVSLLHCGRFVIGTIAQSTRFHVWDIVTGKKVAEEEILTDLPEPRVVPLCYDEGDNQVIFQTFAIRRSDNYSYYGYDLNEMKFARFKLKNTDCSHMMFAPNKCVIWLDSREMYSYSYETTQKLAELKSHTTILSTTIVGNNLICGSPDGAVYVIDPVSLHIRKSAHLGFKLDNLVTICDRFVITNFRSSEVWQMDENNIKRLFVLPQGALFVAINQHGTKIALKKHHKIIILSFW